ELWGDLDGVSRTVRRVGKGRVVWGQPVEATLAALKVPPDVKFSAGLDADYAWLHSRMDDADIYYLANRTDQQRTVERRLRVLGKEPELWLPDSGCSEPVGYEITERGTMVTLEVGPRAAVFIVFRKAASDAHRSFDLHQSWPEGPLEGPWALEFP